MSAPGTPTPSEAQRIACTQNLALLEQQKKALQHALEATERLIRLQRNIIAGLAVAAVGEALKGPPK